MSDRDDWSRHWEDYSDAAARNPAQDYRRDLLLQQLQLPASGAGVRLLDVGSGQGDLAKEIADRYPDAEILGLELSDSGVAISRRKVPAATFEQRNLLEDAAVPSAWQRWATHAVCSEVIEHVDDPEPLLRRARDYMAPGCVLLVTAPGGPMSAFDKHIGHRRHFNPPAIRQLLQAAGYQSLTAAGAGFPFFNLYRCVVILRGKQLIEDVKAGDKNSSSRLANAVMSTFHVLFKMNLSSSAWGWQMLAKGRVPHETQS